MHKLLTADEMIFAGTLLTETRWRRVAIWHTLESVIAAIIEHES
jgi:hypothetical protein